MSPFQVIVEGGALHARLKGAVSPERAAMFREELCAALQKAGSKLAVLIDFRGMTECGIYARSELIEMQKRLKDVARRTAYIADVARFRGLAMWIVNISDDPNAKVCVSEEQVAAWFDTTISRLQEIETRTASALARTRGLKK